MFPLMTLFNPLKTEYRGVVTFLAYRLSGHLGDLLPRILSLPGRLFLVQAPPEIHGPLQMLSDMRFIA